MLALIACASKIVGFRSELNPDFNSTKFIGGIGRDNTMPWKIKKDLKFFKDLTFGHIVIMGGNTYKAIGKALPGRTNIVLSTTLKVKDALVLKKMSQLYDYIKNNSYDKKMFIIGGEQLYKEFINDGLCSEIYLTWIDKEYQCDTYFPVINSDYSMIYSSENNFDETENANFRFLKFKRTNNKRTEREYLKLGKYILDNGHMKKNRTETDTLSVFSYQMRFNISAGVPLLTTKRVPWKVCIEELLWFLRGETDVKILQDKGIKIWDGNTSRKFLDDMGFYDVPEWELRNGYGHQIRRYGSNEVDQLNYVETLLKKDPNSRRIMWNLWNASDLDKMVLTPCFLKDNYVISDRGYLKVNEVIENVDRLLTHKGKYQKCVNVQKSIYKDEIYTIKLHKNPATITCTKEHLFYVCEKINKENKIWLEASEIDSSKHLFCMKINQESIPIQVSLCDLTESQKYHLKEHKVWYLIGYLYDNATCIKDYKISSSTYLNGIIEKIIDISSTYKISKKCDCETCDHEKNIVFKSRLVWTILQRLRDDNEFVHDLPGEDISLFLKGFIFQNKIIYDVTVILFLQRLYAKIGFMMNVKELKSGFKVGKISKLENKEWLYYEVENISRKKPIEGVEVYNLETEEDHTYTISNCITHNCHNQVQFYVRNKKYLSAQLYCRSSDYFLGLPFNIFSYTVLVYILAKRCDLIPDELIITLGDAHIYENHIDQVHEMLKREMRTLPMFIVNDSVKYKRYEDITIDDFKIVGYFPQKTIKAKMAV